MAVTQPLAAQTLGQQIHIGREGSGTSVTYDGATAGGEAYTIVGGGADLWDRQDEFTFTYHELAGDFDIKCQVTSIQPTARYSKAGIIAKETLAEDSRRVAQVVSPPAVPTENGDTGVNTMEMLWRIGRYDSVANDGDNAGNHNANVLAPAYPNAWIRLVREGGKFRGYVGSDGQNWTLTSEQDTTTWSSGPMAGKILVGLGVSRHPSAAAGARCRAVFTNYVETFPTFVLGETMSLNTNEVVLYFNHPVKADANALSPENYTISGGPDLFGVFVQGVRQGAAPNVLILTTDPMTEGPAPYVVYAGSEAMPIVDINDQPLATGGNTNSFLHPGKVGEYALRRIHVHRNQFEGGGTDFYLGSTAYRLGIPSRVYNRPPYEGNTVFEDTLPTGDQPGGADRYSTRIVGVVDLAAEGNYLFGIANDDDGRLYVSSTDQLNAKSQVAFRACCNGSRDYPNGGLAPTQHLLPGKHLLEYVYSEGGGGNYGAVAWDAGTGTAISSGQSPIPETDLIPSRFAYGAIFYNLGAPTIVSGPASFTGIIGSSTTFSVTADGTPPYEFTWYTNGVAVAGANASSLTFQDIQGSQNGTTVSVCVSNALGGACSATATLNVLQNPKLVAASSKGNCHALFLDFNRLMNLDGTYTVVCSNNVFGAAFYSEDFNATDGGFTVNTPLPYEGPWVYDSATGSWTEAGEATDNAQQNVSYLNSPTITLTSGGPVQLSFAHRHSFEQGGGFWDGGQVRVSVNGGAFTTVPASAFTQNGYQGTIAANDMNAIQNQMAFVGNSADYAGSTITSVCTLGNFSVGDTIQVQFMASNDANTQGEFQPNWQIDSLQLSSLVPNLVPVTVTGVSHGSSESQIKLAVTPNLEEANVYYVTVAGATSQGDNLTVDPDPTVIAVVHGTEFPKFQALYKRYNGIGGTLLTDLYASSKYPNNPDVVSLRSLFEMPTDAADNYGATIAAWYRAPQDGAYRFWMSADDQGGTWLATDANPAHAVQINSEPVWSGSREYASSGNGGNGRGTPPSNGSAPISLTAGQVVYLEGRVKEGGGGDNYSCTVTIDDATVPANGTVPILGDDLVTRRRAPSGYLFDTLCDVFLTQPLADQVGYLGLPVTLNAMIDGTPIAAGNSGWGYYIQWFSNGVAVVGATNATFTTAPLTLANSGDTYSVEFSNDFSAGNASATVTVEERPVVVGASTRNSPDRVYVTFNVPVTLDVNHYVLTNSLEIFPLTLTGVAYGSDQTEVVVTTGSAIPPNSVCGLTVSGVTAVTGGGALVPDPTTVLFQGGPDSFCPDLTQGLPAGVALYGNKLPVVDTTTGTIRVTPEENDSWGGFVWGNVTHTAMTLDVTFDLALYKTQDADPADGFSFNIAPDLAEDPQFRPYEDGVGSGLRICFRTYGGNNPGYRIVYKGQTIGYVNRGNRVMSQVPTSTPEFRRAHLTVTASGLLSLQWGTDQPFTQLQIPNWTGVSGKYGMYARCGGLNVIAAVRNICVQNFTLADAGVSLAQSATTVNECSTVTYTATASGSPPFYYQWLRNGSAVPGAIGPTYTTPSLLCPADQGVVYSVVVTNLFSTANAQGTALTVNCDDVPPMPLSAGSVIGNTIGVLFSEAVDPATATDPNNYSINGGLPGAGIVTPPMVTKDGNSVVFNIDPSVTGSFTVAVSNVLDLCPARNFTGTVLTGMVVSTELISVDVGSGIGTSNPDPKPPGTNYSVAPDEITITTGGSDHWGNADHQHFLYTQRAGDFDVKVKVTRLDLQSSWSKAGLDVRASLDANSPSISTYLDPTNGANQVEAGLRDSVGGGKGDWGTFRPVSSLTPWIRLTREGDVFNAYHSADGLNWTNHATRDLTGGAFPATLYVGVFATPNNGNNGNTTTAQFQGLSISGSATSCGPLSITYDPVSATVTLTWDPATCRLQGTAELKGDPAQTIWQDIDGSSPVTLPATTPFQFFRTTSP